MTPLPQASSLDIGEDKGLTKTLIPQIAGLPSRTLHQHQHLLTTGQETPHCTSTTEAERGSLPPSLWLL